MYFNVLTVRKLNKFRKDSPTSDQYFGLLLILFWFFDCDFDFALLWFRFRMIGRLWRPWPPWPTACGRAAATGSRRSLHPQIASRPTDIRGKVLRVIPLESDHSKNDDLITIIRQKRQLDLRSTFQTKNLKPLKDNFILNQIAKAKFFLI